jgi:hypothetical protein
VKAIRFQLDNICEAIENLCGFCVDSATVSDCGSVLNEITTLEFVLSLIRECWYRRNTQAFYSIVRLLYVTETEFLYIILLRLHTSEICICQRIIFYFKDFICISVFMISGSPVATHFHEWTTVFAWMDHILSFSETGIQCLISRNYKYIFISKN